VLRDPELTEYAYALAKSERYQEALNVLDTLEHPNTRARIIAVLRRVSPVAPTKGSLITWRDHLLPEVRRARSELPQVREYLGEAYVIQGKFDLAKNQLATIERLCGSKECEYYKDLAEALEQAHEL
jgi:hypothetical protein